MRRRTSRWAGWKKAVCSSVRGTHSWVWGFQQKRGEKGGSRGDEVRGSTSSGATSNMQAAAPRASAYKHLALAAALAAAGQRGIPLCLPIGHPLGGVRKGVLPHDGGHPVDRGQRRGGRGTGRRATRLQTAAAVVAAGRWCELSRADQQQQQRGPSPVDVRPGQLHQLAVFSQRHGPALALYEGARRAGWAEIRGGSEAAALAARQPMDRPAPPGRAAP